MNDFIYQQLEKIGIAKHLKYFTQDMIINIMTFLLIIGFLIS